MGKGWPGRLNSEGTNTRKFLTIPILLAIADCSRIISPIQPMTNPGASGESSCNTHVYFQTTRWKNVLAARQNDSPESAAALQKLCKTYWCPLNAYVRRRGYSVEEAEDLTQGFF